MNVHLTYDSGTSYSQLLTNFKATVSHKNPKRVTCSFREKENSEAYASFSLPVEKAKQLAYAILAASATDEVSPIEFNVNESKH